MKFVLWIFLVTFMLQSIDGETNKLRMVELVENENVAIETHNVETEDGYSLTMFRIPSKDPNAQPILLLHGMLFSSDIWVVLGKKSLGFSLSSKYDVWFGNSRGNIYSKKHTTFSTRSTKFWDFSLDDLGEKDLPSMIDFILDKTNKSQILFVGHSQGAAQLLILNSEKPEYVDKVKASVLIAPVAFVKHIRSFILKSWGRILGVISPILPGFQFFRMNGLYSIVLRTVCRPIFPLLQYCLMSELFSIFGTNWHGIDPKTLPKIMKSYPAGTSSKLYYQLSQSYVEEGEHFQKYDYGKKKNSQRYNSEEPPEYNLKKTKNPTYIIYGGNDNLADPQDVELLISKLPNVTNTTLIKEYNHIDMFWGKDVDTQLNQLIIDWLAGMT